jgi:hypothetical protein
MHPFEVAIGLLATEKMATKCREAYRTLKQKNFATDGAFSLSCSKGGAQGSDLQTACDTDGSLVMQ